MSSGAATHTHLILDVVRLEEQDSGGSNTPEQDDTSEVSFRQSLVLRPARGCLPSGCVMLSWFHTLSLSFSYVASSNLKFIV